MPDKSDRYRVQATPLQQVPKRLGNYLVEAGLLTTDQISVILNDQQSTGMRFGEIAVARGWLKEQTVEWVVEKVVKPERQASQRQPQTSTHLSSSPGASQSIAASLGARSVPASPLSSRRLEPVAPNSQSPQAGSGESSSSKESHSTKSFARRDIPISKPLPSVNSADSDVNWVG